MIKQLIHNKSIFLILLASIAAVMLLTIGLLVRNAGAADVVYESNNIRSKGLDAQLLSHGGSLDGCMVERFNASHSPSETSLNCTANDVQLAEYTLISGPTSCIEGEDITVTLMGQFIATSDQRWDVGVFVATDGGDANSLGGSCYNDYLHPVSADNNDLDLTGGFGPFYNGEITEDPGDSCGDIEQGQNTFFQTAQITIKCQDSDNDGNADVSSCTVWANSRSDGSENKPSCTSELDTTAETTAKCTCGNVEISGLTVPLDGSIEVIKDLVPDDAPGRFHLQIDGVTRFADAGDGDSTGPVKVSAGFSADPAPVGDIHTVGELSGSATDLNFYSTEINCEDQEGDSANANGTGPLEVFVETGDAWVCTIKNTISAQTTVIPPLPTETATPTATNTSTPVATEPIVTLTPTATPVTPTLTNTPPSITPTGSVPGASPTTPPTVSPPTIPPGTATPQVLIPVTGDDLSTSGTGTGNNFWLFFYFGIGLLGVGMIFYGIATYYKGNKSK